jgi:hypothetical protein
VKPCGLYGASPICFPVNATFETKVKPVPAGLFNLVNPITTIIYFEILIHQNYPSTPQLTSPKQEAGLTWLVRLGTAKYCVNNSFAVEYLVAK